MTQLMNLLNLAPEIQKAILFLPPVERGRDPITERDLRPIVAILDWRKQGKLWQKMVSTAGKDDKAGKMQKNR